MLDSDIAIVKGILKIHILSPTQTAEQSFHLSFVGFFLYVLKVYVTKLF